MSENNFKLADMVRFRKGQKSKLDTLSLGEPGYTLDTEELVIGGVSKNVFFANKDYVDGQLAQTTILAETSVVTRGRIPDNEIPSSRLRTATQSDRIKLINLSEEVIQAMAGVTPVGSIPEDGSVTLEKLDTYIRTRFKSADQGDLLWQFGGLSPDGSISLRDDRLRTAEVVEVQAGTTITLKEEDIEIVAYEYDSQGNPIDWMADVYSDYLFFDRDVNCRFVVKRKDGEKFTSEDANSRISQIQVFSLNGVMALQKEVNELQKVLNSDLTRPENFERGTFYDSTGELRFMPHPVGRLRTKQHVLFETGDIIRNVKPEEYEIYFYRYDKDNNYLGYVGINDYLPYIVKTPVYGRILLYTNDNDIPNKEDAISALRVIKKNSIESNFEKKQYPALSTIHGVAHMGFSDGAPENTIPAYALAKKMGFKFVEGDAHFTSDGVPVVLHDTTINRTSDGTGTISNMTFANVKAYDFGSWFSSEYEGVKIPSFEEWIRFCKKENLFPEIDIKSTVNVNNVDILMSIVTKYGMREHVLWTAHINQKAILDRIRQLDEKAKLAIWSWTFDDTLVASATSLKNDKNKVYVSLNFNQLTQENSARALEVLNNGIEIETWTVNNASAIPGLINFGVQRILTDGLDVPAILENSQ